MFPREPSPREIANSFRIEFGKNSPKLKLSVMAYLIEHGVTPGPTLPVSEFTAMIEEIMQYITADSDGYAAFIDTLQPTDPEPAETASISTLSVLPTGGLDYL